MTGLTSVIAGGAGRVVTLASTSVGKTAPQSRVPASSTNAAPYEATVAASVRRMTVEKATPTKPSVMAVTAVTRNAETIW